MTEFSASHSQPAPRSARALDVSTRAVNTKQAIKVIKNGNRKVPKFKPKAESAVGPARWSTAVQSWVSEFQKQRRDDSLTAFDSLFK